MTRPWTTADIPRLEGTCAVVTGANSGIGFETARALAHAGATVVLACRDTARGQAALDRLQHEFPEGRIELRPLDLSSLSSVRAFSAAYLQEDRPLNLLVNNAGVMGTPLSRTPEGFELQFGTNHLGHFALTALLAERILASVNPRVVTVASQAHRRGTVDLQDPHWTRRRYRAFAAYGQSKLANLLFTVELQRRFEQSRSGARALAAHPGWTDTHLMDGLPFVRWVASSLAMTPQEGALPTLRAATDPEALGGEYYGPSGPFELKGPPVRVRSSRAARDADTAASLWALSEELVGVRWPEG